MQFIEQWLGIAMRSLRISRLSKDAEATQILQTAVQKLIDAGYPVEERTADGVKIELGNNEVFVTLPQIKKAVEEEEADPGLQEIQDLDEVAYKYAFPDRAIKKEKPEAPAKPEELEIEQKEEPKTEPKEEVQEQAAPAAAEPTKEPAAKKEKPILALGLTAAPEFLTGYKEHLKLSEMLYAYHLVTVFDARQHQIATLEIISSPLSVQSGWSDIIVWISDGSASEVRMSTPQYKSVLMHSLNLSFVVKGSIMDGKYISSVRLAKPLNDAGFSCQVTTRYNHGNGHICIKDDGIEIRLVPLREKNGPSGNAQFYYLIHQDGQPDILGDNMSSEFGTVPFEYRGNKLILAARWKQDTLFAAVGPDK